MSRYSLIVLSLLLITGLVGCASFTPPAPDDPYFAPKIPDVPKHQRVSNGSLFSTNSQMLLYEDRKANQVGDIITVILTEVTDASKQADTETKKESDVSLPNPIIGGRNYSFNSGQSSFEMDIGMESEFKGEAESKQSNKLNGTISVTVQNVLPNGNLIVRGEKWITLNQGDEFIRVSGIIRPQDITSDNTAPSSRLANARIQYSGTGAVADANSHGWLARFFNSSWWPF